MSVFLAALGAVRIIWNEMHEDKIYGTVLYAEDDDEERQDFVWHMTEVAVPSENVMRLIEYLRETKLLDGDKIIIHPINELALPCLKLSERKQALEELFEVEVRMLDNGEESDSYFIHC
ncbi:hypothetical protein [Hymenobacter sp. BT190]|uniref:hypothetical protein n=1 Tax=Hymenobacter sp. BT190 TaxID=2763505 RepID=UPI0016513D5B|nr:hypothetical protein [Hymenobacter sp. BT190]MBC6698247.1 hypothetical protein [Hymenobacter sp. BT190]